MTFGSKFKYQSLVFQAGGKDCKAELRDHDHVVECVAWAPEAATQVILYCEQGGIESTSKAGGYMQKGFLTNKFIVQDPIES